MNNILILSLIIILLLAILYFIKTKFNIKEGLGSSKSGKTTEASVMQKRIDMDGAAKTTQSVKRRCNNPSGIDKKLCVSGELGRYLSGYDLGVRTTNFWRDAMDYQGYDESDVRYIGQGCSGGSQAYRNKGETYPENNNKSYIEITDDNRGDYEPEYTKSYTHYANKYDKLPLSKNLCGVIAKKWAGEKPAFMSYNESKNKCYISNNPPNLANAAACYGEKQYQIGRSKNKLLVGGTGGGVNAIEVKDDMLPLLPRDTLWLDSDKDDWKSSYTTPPPSTTPAPVVKMAAADIKKIGFEYKTTKGSSSIGDDLPDVNSNGSLNTWSKQPLESYSPVNGVFEKMDYTGYLQIDSAGNFRWVSSTDKYYIFFNKYTNVALFYVKNNNNNNFNYSYSTYSRGYNGRNDGEHKSKHAKHAWVLSNFQFPQRVVPPYPTSDEWEQAFNAPISSNKILDWTGGMLNVNPVEHCTSNGVCDIEGQKCDKSIGFCCMKNKNYIDTMNNDLRSAYKDVYTDCRAFTEATGESVCNVPEDALINDPLGKNSTICNVDSSCMKKVEGNKCKNSCEKYKAVKKKREELTESDDDDMRWRSARCWNDTPNWAGSTKHDSNSFSKHIIYVAFLPDNDDGNINNILQVQDEKYTRGITDPSIWYELNRFGDWSGQEARGDTGNWNRQINAINITNNSIEDLKNLEEKSKVLQNNVDKTQELSGDAITPSNIKDDKGVVVAEKVSDGECYINGNWIADESNSSEDMVKMQGSDEEIPQLAESSNTARGWRQYSWDSSAWKDSLTGDVEYDCYTQCTRLYAPGEYAPAPGGTPGSKIATGFAVVNKRGKQNFDNKGRCYCNILPTDDDVNKCEYRSNNYEKGKYTTYKIVNYPDYSKDMRVDDGKATNQQRDKDGNLLDEFKTWSGTLPTNPPPRDCVLSEFGEWSTCDKPCNKGLQERYRTIITSPLHGGKECGELIEERICNEQSCTLAPTLAAADPIEDDPTPAPSDPTTPAPSDPTTPAPSDPNTTTPAPSTAAPSTAALSTVTAETQKPKRIYNKQNICSTEKEESYWDKLLRYLEGTGKCCKETNGLDDLKNQLGELNEPQTCENIDARNTLEGFSTKKIIRGNTNGVTLICKNNNGGGTAGTSSPTGTSSPPGTSSPAGTSSPDVSVEKFINDHGRATKFFLS